MISDLEVAAALRATAEFCRDDGEQKCRGAYHRSADGYATGTPFNPGNASYCAVGYFQLRLGFEHWLEEDHDELLGGPEWADEIEHAFDAGDYSYCAELLEARAERIEAALLGAVPA